MKMTYGAAVDAFLDFVSERFKLNSVIWLDVKNCEFHLASAIGRLRGKPLRLGIRPGDERLRAYAGGERPYQLKEKRKQPRIAAESSVLNVFPVTVGGEVRGALAFEGELGDPSAARRIARFAKRPRRSWKFFGSETKLPVAIGSRGLSGNSMKV